MSAEDIGTALGAACVAALGALWAVLRRRRGRAVLPFRARVRAYFSLRSDEPDTSARPSVEPQPFDDQKTPRRRRPRERDDE